MVPRQQRLTSVRIPEAPGPESIGAYYQAIRALGVPVSSPSSANRRSKLASRDQVPFRIRGSPLEALQVQQCLSRLQPVAFRNTSAAEQELMVPIGSSYSGVTLQVPVPSSMPLVSGS